MAALMRMSRLVNSAAFVRLLNTNAATIPRYISRVTPGIKLLQATRITPGFLSRHLCNPASDVDPVEPSVKQTGSLPTEWPLTARIDFIADQLSRKHSLDSKQLYALLREAERFGKLNVHEAMFLVRCSGQHLVKQTPQERRAISADVLESVEKIMEPATIAFHNVVLMVRLENEDFYDPAEILAELEGQGLKANRITYQVLISAYCLQGDVEGATKILEHMKEQDISVTENVFHALIIGYMKKGDVENAKGVLDMMRAANILPVADTYTALMCGLATLGDYGELKKVLSEAESEDVNLLARHLFPVLNQLAKYDHNAQFTEFLDLIATRFQNRAPYNIMAMNAVHQLGAMGKDEQSREVFNTAVQFFSPEHRNRFALVFVESLVIQNKSYDMIAQTFKSLHKEGALESRDCDRIITELASKHRNTELAMSGRNNMMESGSSLSLHDIRNIVSQRETNKDIDGLYDFINQTYRNSNLYSDVNGLVYQFCRRAFLGLGISSEDVIKQMQEKGFSQRLILQYQIRDHIYDGQFQEATKLYEDVKSYEQVALSKDIITHGLTTSNFNIPDFFKFMKKTRRHMVPDGRFVNIFCSVLNDTITRNDTTGEHAVALIEGYVKNKVPIRSLEIMNKIKAKLLEKGVADDVIQNLDDQMTETVRMYTTPSERLSVSGKAMQDLIDFVGKDPEALPQKLVNYAEIALLRRHLRSKKVDEVVALRTKLEDRGCYFMLQDLKEIVLFELEERKDVECARKYLKKIEDETFSSDRHLILAMATTLVQQERYEEALKELQQQNLPPTRDPDTDLQRLLKVVYAQNDGKLLQDVQKVLVENEYVAAGGDMDWGIRIKAVIATGRSEEILKVCNEAYNAVKSVPEPIGVLEHFVKQEDLDNMQKVVDMLSTTSSEEQVLHQIVVAFLNCNKPRQALKVLQTPNLRFGKEMVETTCKSMYTAERLDSLEQYVKLTKGLVRYMDRDNILFWLIKYYANVSRDVKKAQDVLTMYEEEGLMPTARTKRYLANVLNSYGLEVPADLIVQPGAPPRNPYQQRRRNPNRPLNVEMKSVETDSSQADEKQPSPETSRMTDTV